MQNYKKQSTYLLSWPKIISFTRKYLVKLENLTCLTALLAWFIQLFNPYPDERKWKVRLFSVLRYVKQMFSFWGFWNFCFQFVSFACFCFLEVLIISALQSQSRFSRRRSWWAFAQALSLGCNSLVVFMAWRRNYMWLLNSTELQRHSNLGNA